MAECSNCIHFDVCALRYEKLCKGTLVEDLIHNCSKFKDRRKWTERTENKWVDHGYCVACPVCNHQVNDEYYLGNAVACPNCGALLQPAE